MKNVVISLLASAILLSISSVSYAASKPPGKESKIEASSSAVFVQSITIESNQVAVDIGLPSKVAHLQFVHGSNTIINHYTLSSFSNHFQELTRALKKQFVIPLKNMQGTATFPRRPGKKVIAAINQMAQLAYNMKLPPPGQHEKNAGV